MSKRKFLWACLLVVTSLFFYTCLPTNVYNIAPVFISLLGASLFTFFLVQLVADFKSWEEFNAKDKKIQDWRHKIVPFFVFPGIIMAVIFSVHFYSRETAEILKYGVKVKGKIIAGTGRKFLRGNSTYKVTVEFYTKEGQLYRVKEDVGEHEFRCLGKGKEIDLIYSSENPKLIELFIDDYKSEKY